MVKADIYLQKGLWYATNELRGEVTENYDKNYILPLVFAKHRNKCYEVCNDELYHYRYRRDQLPVSILKQTIYKIDDKHKSKS